MFSFEQAANVLTCRIENEAAKELELNDQVYKFAETLKKSFNKLHSIVKYYLGQQSNIV